MLSSLWKVADESTAHLMKRFYENLNEGQPKDLALQEAQAELLRGQTDVGEEAIDATHPFFWASFQLHGDWK